MIRVGPSTSTSGFRTKLNEFHSQVYVNVDPPPPSSEKNWVGTAPGMSQVLRDNGTIFLSETELQVGQDIPGFHINFSHWKTPFTTLPVTFYSNYSGKVEQLEGEILVARTEPGASLEGLFFRWNQSSVKVYLYPSVNQIYCLGPEAEKLVKPSGTAGKFILTGIIGQSCSSLYLSREEDTSTQMYRLQTVVSSGESVSSILSGSFDLLKTGAAYQYDFSVQSQFVLCFVP